MESVNPRVTTANSFQTVFVPPDDSSPANLASAFFDGTKWIATLLISSVNTKLNYGHKALLEYLSYLCLPCIAARFSAFYGSRNYIRTALVDIVKRGNVDRVVLRKNLERIGWKPDDDYRLLRISMPAHMTEKRSVETGYFPYEKLFQDCIAVKELASVLLLVHNDSEELLEETMPALKKQLRVNSASCGISLPFCNIFHIDSQFELAGIAMRLGSPGERVVFYKDVMIRHLTNEMLASVPIRAICNRAALRIFEYDQKNGTSLLYTLELYLKHNKSISAAASDLYIHKNTMTYRLNSISRITQLNLDDADERTHILFSCMLLRNMVSDHTIRPEV